MKKLLISLALCGLASACNSTRGVTDTSTPTAECESECVTTCDEAAKSECSSSKSECSTEAKVCPVTGSIN